MRLRCGPTSTRERRRRRNYSVEYPRGIRDTLSWVMIWTSTESLGRGWKITRRWSTASRSVTPTRLFYRTRDASGVDNLAAHRISVEDETRNSSGNEQYWRNRKQ